jgi:hypothetical protein
VPALLALLALPVVLPVVLVVGCAPRALSPPILTERRDPAPLAARLDAYDAGPRAVRAVGSVRASGNPSADFGATVAAGVGLRFDAVAGPFSTPVFALACRSGIECRGFVPSRGRVYVDEGATWQPLLAAVLRGRVPRLPGAAPSSAWDTAGGGPALILGDGGGWEERVDFSAAGDRPARVFLGKAGERPALEIRYEEFGPPVEGQPFPRRVALWFEGPDRAYEITFRRVEPAPPGLDPALFALTVPPGTPEERVRGSDTWVHKDLPLWPLLRKAGAGPPE